MWVMPAWRGYPSGSPPEGGSSPTTEELAAVDVDGVPAPEHMKLKPQQGKRARS